MIKIILHYTNQKIQEYITNFNGSRQRWMHDITLDEIHAVIDLLIYGGVFKFSHILLELLYKMDCTERLIFRAGVMEKNCLWFLLSIMRFDDKVTKAKRRLNYKLAAFHKIWDIFAETCNLMYLVGELLQLSFRGRYAFRQYMPEKPSKDGNKI